METEEIIAESSKQIEDPETINARIEEELSRILGPKVDYTERIMEAEEQLREAEKKRQMLVTQMDRDDTLEMLETAADENQIIASSQVKKVRRKAIVVHDPLAVNQQHSSEFQYIEAKMQTDEEEKRAQLDSVKAPDLKSRIISSLKVDRANGLPRPVWGSRVLEEMYREKQLSLSTMTQESYTAHIQDLRRNWRATVEKVKQDFIRDEWQRQIAVDADAGVPEKLRGISVERPISMSGREIITDHPAAKCYDLYDGMDVKSLQRLINARRSLPHTAHWPNKNDLKSRSFYDLSDMLFDQDQAMMAFKDTYQPLTSTSKRAALRRSVSIRFERFWFLR